MLQHQETEIRKIAFEIGQELRLRGFPRYGSSSAQIFSEICLLLEKKADIDDPLMKLTARQAHVLRKMGSVMRFIFTENAFSQEMSRELLDLLEKGERIYC